MRFSKAGGQFSAVFQVLDRTPDYFAAGLPYSEVLSSNDNRGRKSQPPKPWISQTSFNSPIALLQLAEIGQIKARRYRRIRSEQLTMQIAGGFAE